MTESVFGPDDFAVNTGVSRETLDRLKLYARLLLEWQDRLNLIGPSTIPDLWRRHMWDSAQVLDHVSGRVWLDLGSGAGFPGLVIAVMGAGQVHLVEKSPKKCQFLRTVVRETQAPALVHEGRAEDLKLPAIDVVVSRACAPLPRLLAMAYPFFGQGTRALFHKGLNLDEELTQATKCWKMGHCVIPSATDPRGRLLRVESLSRAKHAS